MEFIDLQAQYSRIGENIDKRIAQVLRDGKYILGPEVGELEVKLARYAGVKHCIGVGNGTDALLIALMALDIGPGDAVFVPAFTFFASAEVIASVGATPVFVDIRLDSYNICSESLEKQILETKSSGELRLSAVIAVNLFGVPADYDSLEKICAREGLKLIEDAAQSFGAKLGGRLSGSFGDVAATSFFPAKPLGCYGDGGVLLTDCDQLAEKIRSIRVHGKGSDKYENVRIGVNSRLDTIQAAILLEKLDIYDEEIALRNEVAARYSEALTEKYEIPFVPKECLSVWAQYTLRTSKERRDGVLQVMKGAKIPCAIYYPLSVHLQAAFKDLAVNGHLVRDLDLPNCVRAQQEVFSIPMHPYLSLKDQSKVIDALLD